MRLMHKFASAAQTLAAMIVVSILAVACGGGGGGSAPITSSTSFTVTPLKGQFCSGALVAAYDANNTLVGQASVNTSGVASLSVPSNVSVPLHITVGAGQGGSCYWDEAVAAFVSIPAQTVTLNAAVPNLQTASASGVGITIFTELAYQRISSGVPLTSLTTSEVQAANKAVAELFGLAASGVTDVLHTPTMIGQNTPKLTSSTSTSDLYALAVATMAKVSASIMPNLKPAEAARQWLNRSALNPASGVAVLPEAQNWGAAWSAATTGASSVLAAGVTAPPPPALSTHPLNGPTISFNSANNYVGLNGLNGNFIISGWIGTTSTRVTGSGTITIGAATQGSLNGAAVLQQVETMSGMLSSADGTVYSFGGSATKFMNPVSYTEIAISTADDYTVYSTFNYPVSMRAGDAGVLATATVYSSSLMTAVLGTEKYSYSVASDTLSSLLLTFTMDGYDTNNVHTYQERSTFRVATNGMVIPLSNVIINYGTGNSLAGTVPFSFNITISSATVPALAPAPPPPPAPAPPPAQPFTPIPSPLPPLSQSVAYQIDYAHTGRSTLTGPIAFPNIPSWSVNLNGMLSYPLVAGGKVFVLSAGMTGKQLYALDLITGNIAWGPVAIAGTYPWAGHAYDHGKIFVINFDGLLKSFDAVTGAPGWSTKLPGQYAFSAPPTAVNGIVYVGGAGSGGTLYAVDESNGNVLWTRSVTNGDKSSPTVSADGVFVSYPCQVYKFEPLTGATLWHYSGGCSGGGGRTTAYANGMLYVRDWVNMTLGQTIYNAVTGTQAGNFASATIPALTNQAGFFNSAGTLQAVDLASRNVLWSFAGDGKLVSAPIIINQYVIIGSSSGNIYALDSANGNQVWNGNAGALISGPDEQNVSQPLTGFGAGEGYLVVPAGNVLTAWRVSP